MNCCVILLHLLQFRANLKYFVIKFHFSFLLNVVNMINGNTAVHAIVNETGLHVEARLANNSNQ